MARAEPEDVATNLPLRHSLPTSSASTMANTCANLTEAARSVQLFRINGFTATKEKSGLIASRIWTVGGHDWQIDFHPNGREEYYSGVWMKTRLSLVSKASKVPASFSCRPVHPDPDHSSSIGARHEKTMSSVFDQGTFADLMLMTRQDLESRGYVKDESLIVQCAINVLLGGEPHPAMAAAAVPEPCSSDLQKDLGELMRIQKGADITFQASGESIAARRCVLVARSPVFATELLASETESQCVEIKDMEAQVFKTMLRFIYTDTSPDLEEKEMAPRLLEAADRFGLEKLKGICVEKVCTSISLNTVATALALAEQHGCSKLKDRCIDFVLANLGRFDDIAATEGYKHLETRCPSALTDLLKVMVHPRHKRALNGSFISIK